MVCLFKKTADCQCRTNSSKRTVSLGHRRLRFSFQINDFKDQGHQGLSDCLAPVCGGGGCLNRFVFRVKHFFLKKFSTTSKPSEDRSEGGGYLPIHQLPVNPIFRSFSNPIQRPNPKKQKQNHQPIKGQTIQFLGRRPVPANPSGPARHRASGRYTHTPRSPQPLFHPTVKFLKQQQFGPKCGR